MKKVSSPSSKQHLQALGLFNRGTEVTHAQRWEERYAEMVAFQKEHGHTDVTKHQNAVLGRWRFVQRELRKNGKLSAERIARLEEIGFTWEDSRWIGMARRKWEVKSWERRLEDLKAFRERYGHCKMPKDWAEDMSLATWARTQRKLGRQGTLKPERRARLDELGFTWKSNYRLLLPPFKTAWSKSRSREDLWEKRYAEMVAFQKEHGDTDVSRTENRVLWYWRIAQRGARKMGKLSAERIARLEEIGFTWGNRGWPEMSREEWKAEQWAEKLSQLKAFGERYGHCQVPKGWEPDVTLATWVTTQRKLNRQGTLRPERRARLDELGFAWKPNSRLQLPPLKTVWSKNRLLETLWEKRYAEMAAFQKEYGHTNVSPGLNAVLGRWRKAQRVTRKMGKLSAERIARLEEIGFTWEG